MKVKTKREREFRENIKKIGIWIFLVIFVVSIAGVTLVTAVAR